MQRANKNSTKKILWTLGLSCCLLVFSAPVQSFAEEKTEQKMLEQETVKQETKQLPSFGGKLDLTPHVPQESAENKPEQQSLNADKNSVTAIDKTEQETTQKQEQPRLPTRRDSILAPGHGNNSVIMQEDGSNVMIVHGSNKIPENYTNSTNVNNGFYMNITNPDGSGMNMGTYFNSNSNSNSPRKQSKAQMIIDKME